MLRNICGVVWGGFKIVRRWAGLVALVIVIVLATETERQLRLQSSRISSTALDVRLWRPDVVTANERCRELEGRVERLDVALRGRVEDAGRARATDANALLEFAVDMGAAADTLARRARQAKEDGGAWAPPALPDMR